MSSISAAERIVARGFAFCCPAISGLNRVPVHRGQPRHRCWQKPAYRWNPLNLASSVRMSKSVLYYNRINWFGLHTNCMEQLSTYRCSSSTSGIHGSVITSHPEAAAGQNIDPLSTEVNFFFFWPSQRQDALCGQFPRSGKPGYQWPAPHHPLSPSF